MAINGSNSVSPFALTLILGTSLALQACGEAADSKTKQLDSNAATQASAAGSATTAASAITTKAKLSASEEAAIMRAAGFDEQQGKGEWYDNGDCDQYGTIEEMRDINGDGQPEAVIEAWGTCWGRLSNTTLMHKTGGKWAVLDEGSGPDFSVYPRKGIAWPDLEIGNPDGKAKECLHFLRWTGKQYEPGGTSMNGKICKLEPGIAAVASTAQASAAPGHSKYLPLPIGYYTGMKGANGKPDCTSEFDIKYLSEDAVIYPGGEAESCRFTASKAAGKGRYAVTVKCPDSPATVEEYRVTATSFDWGTNGGDAGEYCAPDKVPQKLRFKG